jgi:lipopolysaccharide transport system ATP-binding protein
MNNRAVIKVDNVSKLYEIGDIGSGSFGNDVRRWWAAIRGKENPFEQVAEANERTKKGSSNFTWALKDVNFEVKQGEVFGIIGKNGAGKSTLLKLLSRTTLPTRGEIKIKGRVASLLEVGTGFHPDLSGRENVFLNGAILGMNKAEIKAKFDEIVDFSGVERYIDTPVKRYSSGMYVRLAFGVAAHLEPEVLIVDEVLAVGDAEFQKKCMGKMKDVSGKGRTVLFVSHSMPSIRLLCDKCMYMKQGQVVNIGNTDEIIGEYLLGETSSGDHSSGHIPEKLSIYSTGEAKFKKAQVLNDKGEVTSQLDFTSNFSFDLELEVFKALENISISVYVVNRYGERVIMSNNHEKYLPMSIQPGEYRLMVDFDEVLMPGNYSIGMSIAHFQTGNAIDYIESFYPFTVNKESVTRNFEYPWLNVHGYIKPKTKWTINKK